MSQRHDSTTASTANNSVWRLGIIMVLFMGIVLGVFYWQGSRQTSASDGTNGVLSSVDDRIPNVTFSDVTEDAGIEFVHKNGAAGEKLLPETMGSGVAFFDFDNDGDQDLLFVNSTRWPWDKATNNEPPGTAALYRNDTTPGGEIRFVDVTAGSGLNVPIYSMGVAIGDVDADGLLDVYLTAVGPNYLFKNLGAGRFKDVTTESGTAGGNKDWGTSTTFLDYDGDGDLDLFVCNYVQWSRELDLELNFELPGIGRAYGPPHNFKGSFPNLFKNDGKGRFTDVSKAAGLHVKNPSDGSPLAKSLGVSPVDIDGDGWVDLVIANDTVQNFVFLNQRNGTFAEIGARSGIAFDASGATRGAMGIDAAHAGAPDQLAIAIGNFANENTALYLAQTDPLLFSDEAIAKGIGDATRMALTFGVFFFDFDLDGYQDLLTINGHIENRIEAKVKGQSYLQSPQLFWNAEKLGAGRGFVLVSSNSVGGDLYQPIVGRGSAFADVDMDGDLDVVVTQVGGSAKLFRNNADPKSWCRVELIGSPGNKLALGATLRYQNSLERSVIGTRGYLSYSDPAVMLPLEKSSATLSVKWPQKTVGIQQTVKQGRNVIRIDK